MAPKASENSSALKRARESEDGYIAGFASLEDLLEVLAREGL